MENTSVFATWSKKLAPWVVSLMPWWWWPRCGAVIFGAMVPHAHAYQHGNSLAYRALLHLCQKKRLPKSRKEANPKKKQHCLLQVHSIFLFICLIHTLHKRRKVPCARRAQGTKIQAIFGKKWACCCYTGLPLLHWSTLGATQTEQPLVVHC